MQILNLINIERTQIPWSKVHFPDGEVMIRLGEINRKDEVDIHCRITNAEDLFILMQVGDILNRMEVGWYLRIYYLMSMRLDRVIDFSEPFSLKVVANIIKGLNPKGIKVYHPHSIRSLELLKAYPFGNIHPNHMDFEGRYVQICFPDAGAKERYEGFIDNPNPILTGRKVRNKETGEIESIQLENPEEYRSLPVIVVDDLCDAGGTFLGIANAIRRIDANAELSISVVHMVNRIGIDRLSKCYDNVYFTNTYKDWDNLPDNCVMYNITDNNKDNN